MFFLWISEFSVNQNHALKSWVRLSRASLHQSANLVILQPAAARSLKAGSQFFKTSLVSACASHWFDEVQAPVIPFHRNMGSFRSSPFLRLE